MTNEFARIRWMTERIAATEPPPGREPAGHTVLGVGDDAAIWEPPEGHRAVLTVDVVVEGVHFRREWLTPEQLGRRAVVVAASDLAAMAASPGGILIALTLGAEEPEAFFRPLFDGLLAGACELELSVLGGNLSGGPLAITVTAVGSVPRDRVVSRAGANAGDTIFISGAPGRAGLGRELLLRGGEVAGVAGTSADACVDAFRQPRARLREAALLADRVSLHSMIDVSDGVGADLAHMLRASNVGAVISERALIESLEGDGSSDSFSEVAASLEMDPVEAVLSGGEDYELLFTAPPDARGVVGQCAATSQVPIRAIGEVVAGEGIELVDESGNRRPWRGRGFEHF